MTRLPSAQAGTSLLDYRGLAWRRLAYFGSRFGPKALVKHSPAWFAVAFGLTSTRQREAVRRNLRRLLGPRPLLLEEYDILRTFVAYGHCLAESLGAERADAKAARCIVRQQERLDALIRAGTGLVIGTAHTGGWDIAAQCLLKHAARRVVLVMDREPDGRAMALQDSVRGRRGIEVVHVGADALEGLALLRHLKEGGIVAVQLDRLPTGSRGIEVPLGGRPFLVPRGPFILASLAQVPLLPLFVARRGYYEYEVRVGECLRVPRRLPAGEVFGHAERVIRQLEAFLLDYPEQWFNFTED